jgi:hypothetical protein
MGRASLLLLGLGAFVGLGGCVQTRQYADVEFTAPRGDYDLIVMRPVVEVGVVTAAGLVQPNAEWSDQARAHLVEALRNYESQRGGRTVFLDTRAGLEGVSPDTIANLERLFINVGNSIILHRYMGAELPTKRGRGLDWTLGEDAVAFGRATGMEYALFLHAEDSIASTERTALQIVGIAGCAIGFCAPQQGGGQAAYASLVDLRTGEVSWFNILQTSSMLPGVRFGDLRTAEGAAQLVDRLIGRVQPGRNVRGEADVRDQEPPPEGLAQPPAQDQPESPPESQADSDPQ